MTQQNLRELARQGDPTVIASVINRTLQPKGITAQVGRDNDCLQVMLESDQVPNQYALMDFLRKGIMNLGIESVQTVKVYGRQVGEDLPAWEDEIELMPANQMFDTDEGEMPKKPVDDDDFERENYDRGEEYNPDEDEDDHEHEEDEDEHEVDEDEAEESSSQKKQIPKVAMIAGGVVVLLGAAIAGLFFTGNLPFANTSASESPTPSPVTSPKAVSPKPKSTASSPPGKVNTAKAGSPSPVAASPSPAKPSPVSPSPVATSPSPVSPSPVATSPSPAVAASPSPVATSPSPTVAASPSPVAASPSPTVAASPSPVAASPSPTVAASPKAASPSPKPTAAKPDSWRAGVNKAQNAANLAQTSISKGEWEEVASEWEKAVQLMKAVPPSSPNYQKAQQKAAEYQSNLDIAKRRAAAAE